MTVLVCEDFDYWGAEYRLDRCRRAARKDAVTDDEFLGL
jgi:hypothetical protein